ncbi:MAG: NAD(P)H-dependent oxidoreductase subunit E [Alphaproteobacteria bacterium]|jgi:formate dehydrogenase|nr:NAD(P)H-dependent oxidoreductase subunit E [Alphaproteobacteria bacterium]MDP6567208.1 NAD(P)H-dependent oxidoreductase subunit E [Alphaproteobacteria bacterium]MDP6813469.1 NAD(P)H-dependent oxidoreductase subunit E [Alphaproteobacteria bacterium]
MKGRQPDPAALAELRDILGEEGLRRDMLLEYLHALQDHHGHLSTRLLAALAQAMRLSQAEVYEVASFYHRFRIVGEAEAAPAGRRVDVCDGLVCQLAGADALAAALAADGGDGRIGRGACMGRCEQAPVAAADDSYIGQADPARIAAGLRGEIVEDRAPEVTFADYREGGGYDLLQQCRNGDHEPDWIIGRLSDSGLRGLGGAGFPTGRKWQLVRAEPAPRLLVVNADESEPGTFKDRYYLERDPHRFIEGMLLAAWTVAADEIYIYLRDEYPHLRRLLQRELVVARQAGIAVPEVHLRRGAGAYVCGEESAMLESIEGKRGLPRQRPPYPSQSGLFGRPTLINNVETLYWVRDAVNDGGDWPGQRSFSVSGRVREPGVKLAPAGISLRRLIDDYCGGMADGHQLAAFLPGGASGGILPAELADQPLDFGSLEDHGGLLGSAAVIVLSDRDDIRAAVANLMRFFADESCGQCTPCRLGTEKAVAMLAAGPADAAALADLAQVMADASICGLGHAAANPLRCALRHFPGAIA